MYPLRVLDLNQSPKNPSQWTKRSLPLLYPFTKKFNVSYIPINDDDFDAEKFHDPSVIAASFGRNESDFIDAKYFGLLVENSTCGPLFYMEECHLASAYPSSKRDQHYDFVTIFHEVDCHTIAILVMTILIVALLYSSSSKKLFYSLWIMLSNFLKNSFINPKSSRKKLLLTSFALFISLFHIVFLAFLNTNVISTSHVEPVDTLKDLLRLNISIMHYQQSCSAFFIRSHDKDSRLVNARSISTTAKNMPLDHIMKGNYHVAEINSKLFINSWTQAKCMFRMWPISELQKIHVSSSSIYSQPSNPFYRKNLSAKIVKRLNQYIHRSLDADLTNTIILRIYDRKYRRDPDRKITECYHMNDKVLAEFSTLSLGYFKTTFLIFMIVIVIAVIALLCELKF